MGKLKEKIKEKFLEITTSMDIPETPLPLDVIDKWNKTLDYDFSMKRKFSYFDIVLKTKNVGRGFKGHLTKTQNGLNKAIEFHKLDPKATMKQLYHLYPPKYF